jgi:hypothetical protein
MEDWNFLLRHTRGTEISIKDMVWQSWRPRGPPRVSVYASFPSARFSSPSVGPVSRVLVISCHMVSDATDHLVVGCVAWNFRIRGTLSEAVQLYLPSVSSSLLKDVVLPPSVTNKSCYICFRCPHHYLYLCVLVDESCQLLSMDCILHCRLV